MSTAMKRPAAAQAKAVAVKRPKDHNAEARKEVFAALAKRTKVGEPCLPQDVVQMLSAMLEGALGPAPTAEAPELRRHKFQDSILDFVAAELKVVESSLAADVAAQQELVSGADGIRAERTAVESKAKAELELRAAAATGAKANFKAADDAAAAAKTKVKELEAVRVAAEAAKSRAEKKEIALKEALEGKAKFDEPEPEAAAPPPVDEVGSPKATRTPPKSPSKRKSEASNFASTLKGLVDDDILEATRLSLAKAPADRGEFDKSVVEQLQTSLAQSLTEQMQEVQKLGAELETNVKAVAEAQASAEALVEAKVTAELAESDAECARESAERELRDASKALANLDVEVQQSNNRVAAASAKLEEYRETVLAAFDRLRNPPVPEPPALETPLEPEPEQTEA